ncbi:MAG: hypothetical protein WBQ94_17215 [Terracidiphilus sp.]
MIQARQLRVFGVVAVATIAVGVLAAQAGDPAVMQQKLNAKFKVTITTADRTDIVTAGDVVQLHKPGVVMFSADSPVPPTNVYKDGKMGQGFGTAMIMSNPQTNQRRFVPDEKCWVTRVMVQKDGVAFDLYSDPYNDMHYYGTLKIQYPDKKAVPPVDSFLQTVAEVITVVQSDDQAGQGSQQAPPPARAPVAAPPPPPMQTIAPPPPPADQPPPTIDIGQTKDQVTAAFGQPMRMAKLGVKEIFYYKDMKVTFTNGKVSNVE